MPPPRPTEHPNPNSPVYLLVLVLGTAAFVVGGVVAVLLYAAGGSGLVLQGLAIGAIVYAVLFSALLRLRDG